MKIITSYPIIKNGKVVANGEYNTTLDYSSVTGVGKAASGSTNVATSGAAKPTGGSFDWANLGQNVDKAVQGVGSISGAVKGLFGKQKKQPKQQQQQFIPTEQTKETGMSTTTMVLIGVGVVGLIGVIFLAKRNNWKRLAIYWPY